MLALIDSLNKYLWLADFLTFCVIGAFTIVNRKNTSSLITIGAVVLMTGIIIQYKEMANAFASPQADSFTFMWWCIGFLLLDLLIVFLVAWHARILKKNHKAFKAIVVLIGGLGLLGMMIYAQYGVLTLSNDALNWKAWRLAAYYLGYAGFAVLTIFVLRKLHELSNEKIGLLAKTYSFAFLMAALIHIVRFFEEYILHGHDILSGIYKWGMASINISTSAVGLLIAALAIYQYLANTNHKGALWEL